MMGKRHLAYAAVAGIVGFVTMMVCIALFTSLRGPGGAMAVASIGQPFTLVDDLGAVVTERTLAGKPSAIYFGYTYCPEVCPTTLLDLSNWIEKLGPDADKINFVFVTVDPERDTVDLMHSYLSAFDKHIRGFTGTPAQVAKIAREYRVYYKRIPTDDGSYVVDHSAVIYLMGPDEKFVNLIAYKEGDDSALEKLRNLAALTPSS